MSRGNGRGLGWLALVVSCAVACTASKASSLLDEEGPPPDDDTPTGAGGLDIDPGQGGNNEDPPKVGDPTTCAEAADYKTYVGCDFWPTVTANSVWSIFDYAVVVANAGMETAEVTVERGGTVVATADIAADSIGTIYLPWVPELKGLDADSCGVPFPLLGSVQVPDGAYHLTSTVPVTVYQFSALEYTAVGGPPGKDWSSCPAAQCSIECNSYSNDASLLLPSTAMTGNYRVTGTAGWTQANIGGFFTITATQDDTEVTAFVSSQGAVIVGNGIPATPANGQVTLSLDAGDVAQLVGTAQGDLSGSLVQADKPVQVIAGMPCINLPATQGYCDHIEESVLPAETLGERYFVTVPTSPHGTVYGHKVRLYGNVDGTSLTYPSGNVPPGAPSVIQAGQVVDLGIVSQSFEVVSSHEIAVGMFTLGASLVDAGMPPPEQMGDPDASQATAVEQYRTKYVFLAPNDYAESYLDIIQPLDAIVVLDGAPVTAIPTHIGSGFGIARVALTTGTGSHVLTSDKPVGIQVMGYGKATSYQFPGGMNLALIAPPPDPPE